MSFCIFHNLFQTLIIHFQTCNTKPIKDLNSSSNINILQEFFIVVFFFQLPWSTESWIENYRIQNWLYWVFNYLSFFLMVQDFVTEYSLRHFWVDKNSSVRSKYLILIDLVSFINNKWNLWSFRHALLQCILKDEDSWAVCITIYKLSANDLIRLVHIWD